MLNTFVAGSTWWIHFKHDTPRRADVLSFAKRKFTILLQLQGKTFKLMCTVQPGGYILLQFLGITFNHDTPQADVHRTTWWINFTAIAGNNI